MLFVLLTLKFKAMSRKCDLMPCNLFGDMGAVKNALFEHGELQYGDLLHCNIVVKYSVARVCWSVLLSVSCFVQYCPGT